MFKLIAIFLGVAVLAGGGYWYWRYRSVPAYAFRTAEVKKGNLVPTIGATGTIEPEEVVDVGAQVAGLITTFGTDTNGKMVDYGSPVDVGTVLARIDDTLYTADASSAQAQLEQAQAGVTRAIADLGQMKAKLEQSENDWMRAQKLGPSDALSQSDYNGYKAAYATAVANVGVDEAAIAQAKATVTQAEATLKRATQNLGYCTIKSPVKGVIIDRRVNIGQTVVSSLNAPSLFLLAKDLTRMQVWASVNEADVGNIHPGQVATFSVDAFPGRKFKATVGKVRLNATMTQNVVTYTVEVTTDNSDGKLLPYLTANLQFELDRRNDVLTVPNAALRFYPAVDMVAPEFKDEVAAATSAKGPGGGGGGGGGGGKAGGGAPPNGGAGGGSGGAASSAGGGSGGRADHAAGADGGKAHSRQNGTLWVKDETTGLLKPITVHVGVTDGLMTEVSGDDLKEGTEIVTGEIRAGSTGDGTTNPFAPQFPKRR
ncbi:MAG: efflux transporter, family, subunit [Massilia sp.]|nr:efflux transporter, family, subunit [Phycisphaerales bacterium]MDB5911155.1 efflux transporter, family, subunit [Massilia sp.]